MQTRRFKYLPDDAVIFLDGDSVRKGDLEGRYEDRGSGGSEG